MGQIALQRVREYVDQPAVARDTKVVLVDRVWPRGIAKTDLPDVRWLREVAPSTELRKWFGHDPQKWEQFRERYLGELGHNAAAPELLDTAREGDVLLLFDAKDAEHNQAVVLAEWLRDRLSS